MPNPLRKLLQKAPWKLITPSTIYTAFTFLFLAGILLALYLPLPAAHMPLASVVYDRHHNMVTTFFRENRLPVTVNDNPLFLRQAIIAVEDHRYYQHHGINIGRIIKAFFFNIQHREISQGASTITQQLAKNAYLTQERTFIRKIKELFYAVKIELHLSKEKILEQYLNQIYFGHGAYGTKVAATTYFHKELNDLNEAEMALLAGLPKGPALFSPYTHPEAARERIAEVLQRMVACHFISAAAAQRYQSQPLQLPGLTAPSRPAPYYLDYLQNEMERIFPKEPGILYQGGLTIETAFDPTLQRYAESALQNGLPRLLNDRQGLSQPQGGLLAVNPATGEILALCGGTDFSKSQFNRITQAKRQPGSAFKPLLYATALNHGFTLATHISATPENYYLGNGIYRPTDEGHLSSEEPSLREALASSSNVVAVKLINQLGIKNVVDLATTLGISSPLPRHLSLALGSGEVTPLELTTAYLPLANGGYKTNPTTIRRILDRNGRVIYEAPHEHPRVIDPGIAFLVTQALRSVFHDGGTAAGLHWPEEYHPPAGKTGTTEANRDAWFIGYTPRMLTCVYVGCDQNEQPLPGAASQVAAPIWSAFMSRALSGETTPEFTVPSDIVQISVCAETGAIATAYCPARQEYFMSGTEPKDYCQQHRFVELEICRRSGLLPGPYCRHTERKVFRFGEQPTIPCDRCQFSPSIFDWFRKLFRSP